MLFASHQHPQFLLALRSVNNADSDVSSCNSPGTRGAVTDNKLTPNLLVLKICKIVYSHIYSLKFIWACLTDEMVQTVRVPVVYS